VVVQFDAIVVGAGPAGATVARQLAIRGLKTLIIEKQRLPRYKSCGGALPGALSHLLDFNYRYAIEKMVHKVTFISIKREFCCVSPEGMHVDLVNRSSFDLTLTEEAVKAGASLMDRTALANLTELKDYVTVTTETGEVISCKVLIGADGAKSLVAFLSGLKRPQCGFTIAAELYTDEKEVFCKYGDSLHFVFGFTPEGYGWIFPKKDYLSVGIIVSRLKMAGMNSIYNRFISSFSDLTKAEVRLRKGWFIPLNLGKRLLNTKHICLVGDAASLVDPFGGEGIYYAIKSGLIAGKIIPFEIAEKGYLSSFLTDEINRQIVEDFSYARMFASMFFKSPQLFYHDPQIIRLFVQLANKNIQYRDILKSLIRFKIAPKGVKHRLI